MSFLSATRRVLISWAVNALNLFLFTITFGNLTVHEGRFYHFFNKWANWNLYFSMKPKQFLQPSTEEEICEIVKNATKVRVCAGGHSFNPGNLSTDTSINLDKFNKVISFDRKAGIITVESGMRLLEFITIIEKAGFDLPIMGTAHTQSIGGIVGSDLHSTGKETGYLAQQLVSLKIVNGKGEAEVFTEESDVFRGALGGIGAMGIVIEVTVKLVKKLLVRRTVTYVDREEAEANLDELLAKHDHIGFFYIAGLKAKKIRLAIYDEAHEYEKRDTFYHLKNTLSQMFDLVTGGFLLDIARYIPGFVQGGYFVWNNTFLGQPYLGYSGEVFTSSLFFRHDEMEYAVPRENFHSTIGALTEYLDNTKTTSLMEVRFCVDKAQTTSLLGPGAGRQSAFVEILPTLTHDTRRIFAGTEHIFESNKGRPHLGKYTTYQTPDFRRHFSNEIVDRFLVARKKQDPENKFVNDFIQQLFLTERESNPTCPLY